ncbi:hypothetical protein V8F06_003403 [Rhypophila decipiens]
MAPGSRTRPRNEEITGSDDEEHDMTALANELDNGMEPEDSDVEEESEPARSRKKTKAKSKSTEFRSRAPSPVTFIIEDLNKDLVVAVQDLNSRMPRYRKLTAESFKKRCPRIVTDLKSVKEEFPLSLISEEWTVEDMKSTAQYWLNSPRRKPALKKIKKNQELLTLYKESIRTWRMIPEDIIHADFELEYVTNVRNVVVDGAADPNWSGTFCKRLRQVMAHTMWMHNPVLLAIALQYVDIILANDHRPWMGDTNVPKYDPFPHMLQELSRGAGSGNIAKLRRDMEVENGPFASLWNILFERIEEVVDHRLKTKGRERPIAKRDAHEHYKVSIKHLEILIEALDTMSYCGFPCWMPVELVSRAIGGARSKHDFPLVKDIEAVRDHILLRLEKRKVMDRREKGKPDFSPEPTERRSKRLRHSRQDPSSEEDSSDSDEEVQEFEEVEDDLPKTAKRAPRGVALPRNRREAMRTMSRIIRPTDDNEFNGMHEEEMPIMPSDEVDSDQESHSGSGPDTVTHITYDDFRTRGVPYLNGEISEDSQSEDDDVGQGPHQEPLSSQASRLKRKASHESDQPVKKAKTEEELPEVPSSPGHHAVGETTSLGQETVTGTAVLPQLGQETPVQVPEEGNESQVQSSIQGGEDATYEQDASMGKVNPHEEENKMIFRRDYEAFLKEYF